MELHPVPAAQPIDPSARRPIRGPRRGAHGLAWSALLLGVGMLRADDRPAPAPAPAADPFAVIGDRPLSMETWPLWRDVFVRICYDDTTDPEQDRAFYERVRAFISATAAASGGTLPKELAGDPMAWVALAYSHLHLAREDRPGGAVRVEELDRAEAASRKGIALGDTQAIPSFSLAEILVSRDRDLLEGKRQPPTAERARRLDEAEARLQRVAQVSPRANVTYWRGLIAELRGDPKAAADLLRRSTEEHPRSAPAAMAYLMNAIAAAGPSKHLADLTGPIAGRFPAAANIQALHAVALYRDERYPEAAEALRRARGLDETATRFLGDETAKAIEEGRHLTPVVASGLSALKAGRYRDAAGSFRKAMARDPHNPLAARLLAQAIAHQVASSRQVRGAPDPSAAIEEIGDLCRRHPDDAEMQGALAVALHVGGRDIEAADALDRMKRSGGRTEEILGDDVVRAIREGEAADRTSRFWQATALAAVIGGVSWIAAMFAMGAVLAAWIPRVPESVEATGQSRSRREVWIERFYLVILSAGLLVFYASVPVVALGLMAVTLALFGLMLAIRIIHFGVLHRGLWATWNVLRSALMGPQRGAVGIEATDEEHPRLFETSRAVAERLQTRPVDVLYLTPSSNISVYQEGAGPFGLLGKRRRVLQVGISTLPLLTRGEFESILAHEYGHFSHRDTFYSRFIFQVSGSLATSLAVMNAAGGVLNYVNPFYWFWWLYLRGYTLLASGFSRTREFLADRRAVAAYGKQAFVSGLTKVSVEGALFDSIIYANVRHLLGQGKAFSNAFDAFRRIRDDTEVAQSRERLLRELQKARPGWFDTHPTYRERLAAVAAFPDAATPAEDEPAIGLISDHQAVEAKLTEILTSHMIRLSGGWNED